MIMRLGIVRRLKNDCEARLFNYVRHCVGISNCQSIVLQAAKVPRSLSLGRMKLLEECKGCCAAALHFVLDLGKCAVTLVIIKRLVVSLPCAPPNTKTNFNIKLTLKTQEPAKSSQGY